MLNFGFLAFASPWMLTALVILPVLWWLLKVTPPAPLLVRFPAVRLLFGLHEEEQTPAKTPLWLVILRMVLAAFVILALAHPLLNPGTRLTGAGPLILVVDDGWAGGHNWGARIGAMDELLDQAERLSRPVMVLGTAPPASGKPVGAPKLLRAADARALVRAMAPKPWPVDRARVLEVIEAAGIEGAANVVWLSDGLDDEAVRPLAERLQRFGNLHVIADEPAALARVLMPPKTEGAEFTLEVLRAEATGEASLWLRGTGDDGRVLVRERVDFADGQTSRQVTLAIPSELRNNLARLALEGENSAGAVVLLDERWRRRPVGLVTTAATDAAQPLLNELYYLERALTPFSEVRKGPVDELLKRSLAVLILTDSNPVTEATLKAVEAWMNKGGTVIRFAGPRLAQKQDGLIPVKLRAGDRSLGGAMSWTRPAALAPFEAGSPFAGIKVPDDVLISRQVLAQPSLDLGAKTWARLADGTPLVTAERRGQGRLALVHTSADIEWSNLPLSGLFVEMLRRIVGLSHGVTGGGAKYSLPPLQTLDGYGRLQNPPAIAEPISGEALARTPIGPTHPPGFYGNDSARIALNLSPSLTKLAAIKELPAGVRRSFYSKTRERDLRPWLLTAALLIAIADMWISLILRGLLPNPWPGKGPGDGSGARAGRGAAASTVAGLLAALLVILQPAGAFAQAGLRPAEAAPAAQAGSASDAFALEATLKTRLAYVETGDPELDATSLAGLTGLSEALTRRTSVEPAKPMAVNVETDELSFFPLIYWPVSPRQSALSRGAREKLNRYLRHGGMILFDTRDQRLGTLITPGAFAPGGPGGRNLRQILSGLEIPPLIPAPQNHILTKAFYLIQDFPGRWAGGTVWVVKGSDYLNDGVSSIIIGANDWAGAWAVNEIGQPLFPVVPGGEQQREMALRFGINLVMYALTGNYKADQVHVPAILERLGQ
ncbi:MAG: DUF4159 domain-containing protein [Proteobacteria bacterium]|nr:DUF4159 domain-containing protein [Pseudomonadota bacterium]